MRFFRVEEQEKIAREWEDIRKAQLQMDSDRKDIASRLHSHTRDVAHTKLQLAADAQSQLNDLMSKHAEFKRKKDEAEVSVEGLGGRAGVWRDKGCVTLRESVAFFPAVAFGAGRVLARPAHGCSSAPIFSRKKTALTDGPLVGGCWPTAGNRWPTAGNRQRLVVSGNHQPPMVPSMTVRKQI